MRTNARLSVMVSPTDYSEGHDESRNPTLNGGGTWNSETRHVAVVGSGYVGCCLGAVLAERGLRVHAIDTNAALVAELSAGFCRLPEPGLAGLVAAGAASGRVEYTTDFDCVKDADVIVLTVGTPVDSTGRLVAGPLLKACREVATRLRPGHLVLVKSTVPPGTTRALAAVLQQGGLACGEEFGLACCPERLAEGSALAQLRELPVVVGGVDAASTAAAARFWREAGMAVTEVSSAETAEVIKLATNWWIDANIAIANELAQFCTVHRVDVMEVVSATNVLPKGTGRVNVLLPSVGVGGSCLTKDPWMAWRSAQDHGVALRTVETARRVNDAMPLRVWRAIHDELVASGRDPSTAVVSVLGVAFKSNTGDLRNSPVLPVVAALRRAGTKVRLCDPLADPAEVEWLFGIKPVPTWQEAVTGADCVAVLAGHRCFAELDLVTLARLAAPRCLVFDGRAYYPPATVARMRELGLSYRGVGR